MAGASKPELAHLVALVDVLADLDLDLGGADLGHADGDEADEAKGRVVGLDEDEGTSGHAGQVALVVDHGVDGVVVADGLVCDLVLGHAEIVALDALDLADRAGHRRVPAVVRSSSQQALVDGAVDERVGRAVAANHVRHAVRLALDPVRVVQLHVRSDLVRRGFAGGCDNVVAFGKGTDVVAQSAREEVVPGREAVVGLRGVAGVQFAELVRCAVRSVGGVLDVLESLRREPAVGVGRQDVARGGRGQVVAPGVEDLVKSDVDVLASEGLLAAAVG